MEETPTDSVAEGRVTAGRGLRLRWPRGFTVGAILLVLLTAIVSPLGERIVDKFLSTEDDGEGVPFTVVAEEVNNLCVDGWIADPSAPYPIPDIDNPASWDRWAAEHGAIPAASRVELAIQGRSNAVVVLLGARVRVVERRPPYEGIHYHKGCGGSPPVRYMTTNLDDDPPVITTEYNEQFDQEKVGPITFPYTVNIADVEIFLLTARTQLCDCDWVIDLDWASEGRQGTYTITKNGSPFRTSGASRVIDRCRDDGNDEFYCGLLLGD